MSSQHVLFYGGTVLITTGAAFLISNTFGKSEDEKVAELVCARGYLYFVLPFSFSNALLLHRRQSMPIGWSIDRRKVKSFKYSLKRLTCLQNFISLLSFPHITFLFARDAISRWSTIMILNSRPNSMVETYPYMAIYTLVLQLTQYCLHFPFRIDQKGENITAFDANKFGATK